MQLDPVTYLALGLAVAAVLGTAGLHKLRAPLHYSAIVEDYRLLPAGTGTVAAGALGVLEALGAVAILLPATRTAGLAAAGVLFALYFAAIALNLRRGRSDIDCGCGAPAERRRLSGALLVRNALLAVVALALAFAAPAARATGWFDSLVALGAGIAAALGYFSADRLLANRDLLARLR